MKTLAIAVILALLLPTDASGKVRVRGYTKKNGTYVAPHYRSSPDRSRSNNWSTRGNVNPYTGKPGTKNPYGGTYYPYSPSSRSFRYRSPSYRYSQPNYGYVSPSYRSSSPSYGSSLQGHGSSQRNYRCPDCSSNQPAVDQANYQQQGEILLASGAVKVPARTQSGYCLRTPYNYFGTGAVGYPAVTSAMPRCVGLEQANDGQ